jgi:hypothetical protein
MAEFFRVWDARTFHQFSTSRVDPDHHEVLEEPAVDRRGRPLPPVHNVAPARDFKPRRKAVSEPANETQTADDPAATPEEMSE